MQSGFLVHFHPENIYYPYNFICDTVKYTRHNWDVSKTLWFLHAYCYGLVWKERFMNRHSSVFLIQLIWFCNLNFRIVKEMGAVVWNPLLFLWYLIKHSKIVLFAIVLFAVRATMEKIRRWTLMKEINKAKKASPASSHFRADGYTPDVSLSHMRDSTIERGNKALGQK